MMNYTGRIPILVSIALFGLVLLFSACQRESPGIRIGMTLWPGYEFLYLAEQKGFFKEENLDVQLFNFVSISDSRRALEREQIDVVAGTLVELLLIREISYKSPQAFYVTDFSNGADVILGRKPIRSIHELNGKRVGVEPASLDLLTINLALRQNQMELTDVVLVPMAQNAMDDSFERNEVDAICTYPPVSVKILNKGNATILFNSSQIPGYIIDVLIADEEMINARVTDLAKIILCFDRAIHYSQDHPDEALAIMAGREQISVPEIKEAYSGMQVEPLKNQMRYFLPNGQLLEASVTALEILRETGVIDRDIRVNDLINEKPVTLALSKQK